MTSKTKIQNVSTQPLPRVAYFCMEYGLDAEFKIYAGGLGILAGDYLKSAGDMHVPLVGIGILWRQGYTAQHINEAGGVVDSYPIHSYDFLKDTGVTVRVNIRGRDVACKVWRVDKYGNAPLFLLDTYLPENQDRWITGQLYGWFSEERVAQEMVLGVGGIRALRALGIDVDVYHFNEGHAVFAGLELMREKMQSSCMSFEQSLDAVRKQIVFTTHTPVREGNEWHEHRLLQYMGAYGHLNYSQMTQVGGDPFNMTVAGLRLSRISNSVAKLHGVTARRMWRDVHGASPIIAITNGVHRPTWQDPRIAQAYSEKTDLWAPHLECKKELLHHIADQTGTQFDPNKLVIGFARRTAPYKRGDFIFRRPDVIEPYLADGRIQLAFAGKAHPLAEDGKAIISTLVNFARKYPRAVVFLENYDITVASRLVRGCDVWLNNPRRPLEASGTSGMKAAMNGCLNLSVLDGWWPEGCEHGINGWQIGDGYEGVGQDDHDLASLYHVLMGDVIPTYYENHAKWVEMMRASISMSRQQFSTDRMLVEYYDNLYSVAEGSLEAGPAYW